MSQNKNLNDGFEIEFSIRLAAKNYRLQLKSTTGWIIAILILLLKIIPYFTKTDP